MMRKGEHWRTRRPGPKAGTVAVEPIRWSLVRRSVINFHGQPFRALPISRPMYISVTSRAARASGSRKCRRIESDFRPSRLGITLKTRNYVCVQYRLHPPLQASAMSQVTSLSSPRPDIQE